MLVPIGQERTPTGRQRQQQVPVVLSTRLPVLQKLDHGLLYCKAGQGWGRLGGRWRLRSLSMDITRGTKRSFEAST